MNTSIKFQIEISKVLKLLANDIYDSPYALLRENVQNAYDAILIRKLDDKTFEPKISIEIIENTITIEDNGIGMTSEILENNYWKAGSSGKNTEDAKKAGVIGTFGIGAMANFGVCSSLIVETRNVKDVGNGLISIADKENLSVSDNCISMNSLSEEREFGTKVTVVLDDNVRMDKESAIQYLKPYVQYLPIPVYLNSCLLSKSDFMPSQSPTAKENKLTESRILRTDDLEFNAKLEIENYSGGKIKVVLTDFSRSLTKEVIEGNAVLEQGNYNIFGLRNYFGLASIPISSMYNLGGIFNLQILIPTAGREALSRDSVNVLAQIIEKSELFISEALAKHSICDNNRDFLSYIYKKNRLDLADNIRINLVGTDTTIPFSNVELEINEKKVYWYSGKDKAIIQNYSNENTNLLTLSEDNPRRNLQKRVLLSKNIPEVSNDIQIIKIFERNDLAINQVAFLFRIEAVLKDDYLVPKSEIHFAEISHNIPNLVKFENSILKIYLAPTSSHVAQVLGVYDASIQHFEGFVKDFVRSYLFPKIVDYIPSSTREGAESLFKLLEKRRELYTIDTDEFGDIENILKDYLRGDITAEHVFSATSRIQRHSSQTVEPEQIGSLETELSAVVPLEESKENLLLNDNKINVDGAPPIKLLSNNTDKKILETDLSYSQLNGYSMFLGLSDKLFNHQFQFFLEPHTTKVIWSMHKIVYIFTHISSSITLYYDIELKEKLPEQTTGGRSIATTTIVFGNRIFIPLIPEIMPYFKIQGNEISFYVRYDTISEL